MSGCKRTNKIKCVLFDLDGTLIDSIPLIRASFRYASEKVLGRVLPDEVLLANVGKPLEEQMKIICPEKATELLEAYREHNHAFHDEMVKPVDGAVEVLAFLKENNVSIGVVTSKSGPLARRGIEVCGIGRFVDALVSANDVLRHKPHPEPVIKCVEMLGCKKENAVFIGDSPYDIESGKNAGVLTIAVPFGPFSKDILLGRNPDYLAEDIFHLKSLLEKLVLGRPQGTSGI